MYIEREKAIDKFTPYVDDLDGISAVFVLGEIEQIPAANVAPVVRGEWVNVRFLTTGDGRIRVGDCPFCKSIEKTSNFCPNCGAKMK